MAVVERHYRRYALAALLLLLFVDAVALQQQIRFERISVEDGLSNAHVTAILQDRSGYMWIGTAHGLNRYDGYDFVTFQHDPDDSASLSDSEVRGIAEDSSGNLWVATRNGLNRFVRGGDQFSRYMHDPADERSLSDNDITALLVDHESVLWVGTRTGGLNRFNAASQSFDRFQYDPNDLVHSISAGPVVAIYEDRYDRLWVATRAHNHGALDEFDRQADEFIHTYGCPNAGHGDCTQFHSGDEHRPVATDINGLYQDSSDAFWLATDSGAIKEHESWLMPYLPVEGESKSLSDNRVLTPLQDQSGRLWFGTKRGGLHLMGPPRPVNWSYPDGVRQRYQYPDDPAWSAVFDRYRHDSDDPHSISSDQLTVLYEDRFGVIWIGTRDAGLSKFTPQSMRFGYYRHVPSDPSGLPDSIVSAVAEDIAGSLWLGTLDGTLIRIDQVRRTMDHYRHTRGANGNPPGPPIHSLHVDANDDLWIGTSTGLRLINKTEGTFKNFDVYPWGPNKHGVLSIDEGPDGILWLGTQSALVRFDIATEEFEYFWSDSSDENALHGGMFRSVEVDQNSIIWVATDNAGVNRFDPKTETAEHFRHSHGLTQGISDDQVTFLWEEVRNETKPAGHFLWIGTRGGLDRYELNDQSWSHYHLEDGLPDNHVTGITQDNSAKLWITTANSGIARLHPATDKFERFDVIDGLQGNRFNAGVIGTVNGGRIIASGDNGINIFDPGRIVPTNNEARLVVTSVTDNDVAAPINGDEVVVSAGPRSLAFEFAALNFANPSRTNYAYRLEGYDAHWIEADAANRVARYRNVAPGDYTFRVRARLGNGEWSGQNFGLGVSVPTPWWQTVWAYAAYVLALVLSIYLIMNVRAVALRRRANALESKVAERTRRIEQNERLIQHQADHLEELLQVKEKLYANISHEFRTPLTLILGPIDRMLRKTRDTEFHSQLAIVRENSQRLLRLVDQLLGLTRLSAEVPVSKAPQPLRPIAATIVDSFRPLAAEKGIQLDLIDGSAHWVSCAPDALEKILLNLISNAIKYTPNSGLVSVRISASDSDVIRLSVSDSGIGIDPQDHGAVFERFYRANGNGNGGATPGAGLGLALVKELAEAYGGSVELESRPGLGTTISVLLPRHETAPVQSESTDEIPDTGLTALEIAATRSPEPSRAPQAGRPNGKPSLLIIEDNVEMQHYLVSLFEDRYQCYVAASGDDGLRLAMEQVPDAIVCDVMLPNMDGFAVSEALKSQEMTSHIPIIMLTGRGDHDSRLKGLRQHVDDYMTKPFNDEELALRLENLLSARKSLKRRFSRQLFDGSEVVGDIGRKEQKFLDKLHKVVEQNYADTNFRVEQLASALAMSDRQLQRKLKALVDHSPAEYLRNFRLLMAKNQLSEGRQVGLVAEAVGFSSQSYFASCFKAEFGQTPTQFQNRLH